MKLQLPTVTLLCVDCLNTDRAIWVLEHCKTKADFGEVKFLTSLETDYKHKVEIMPLKSLIAYSIFMLTRAYKYIDTEHVLIVQRDGWILNPESFKQEWLDYDFIGPLFIQYDKVGSGGFSLRRKSMMIDISQRVPQWDGTQEDAERIQGLVAYYEDGVICLTHKKLYCIAPPKEACLFAQGGNRSPDFIRERPFGFHRTWQEIDFKTGIVDSSNTARDLHASYDLEIDTLK